MKYFLYFFIILFSLTFFSCLQNEIKPIQRTLFISTGIAGDTLIVDGLVDTSIKVVSYFLPFKISLNRPWVQDISGTTQSGTPLDASTSKIRLSLDSNLNVRSRYCLATIEGDYELYGRVNPKRKLVIKHTPTYFIYFNSDTITLDYFETNKDVSFLSNSDLTISFDANNWLTQSVSGINPNSDTNRTLSIITTQNNDSKDRFASCVIYNALTNVSASYVIRQKAIGYLRVSPSKLTINAEVGDTVKFNIESNTKWSVDLSSTSFVRASYLTQTNLSTIKGNGNGIITLVITEESNNYTSDDDNVFNVSIPNKKLFVSLKRKARKCANYKVERQALEDLYNNTGGVNWTKKSNWLSQDDTGYRNWEGVYIDHSNGCISGLYLGTNNIKGSIPESISNLTHINALYLGDNGITSLPSTIGRLTKLTSLGLDGNRSLTSLPAELWNLTNLSTLYMANCIGLDYNDLFSTGGAGLTNLTNLYMLTISHIPLNQSLPNSFFTSIKNLQMLYASSCKIGTTNLSLFFSSFPNMAVLDISLNGFNQSIPASISNLTNILFLTLSNNGLTGSIPNLSNLSKLRTLDMSQNNLSGNIPNSLGGLDSLSSLSLQQNNLSGNIPSNLGNGVRFNTLSAYEIQEGLDLRNFNLSNNSLTGTVPASLCTTISNGLKAILNCNPITLCNGSTAPCP